MSLLEKYSQPKWKLREILGEFMNVKLVPSQWNKVEKTLEEISDQMDMQDGWVDEETICRLLNNISPKTLGNYVSSGRICKSHIGEAPNGARLYNWKKIFGIQEIAA